MTPQYLNLLFAQAGGTTPAAGQSTDGSRMFMVPMIIMMGAFMFVTWRSNSKRAKEQQAMMEAVKTGDKVVTNSGLIGLVTHVREKSVVMRCEDSKLEILKSSLASIEKA